MPYLPALTSDEYIRNSWYGQSCWRWMFGLTAIPSLLFFIGMFLVPESPRWLAKNGQSQAAGTVLRNIGGEAYSSAALADIQATLVNEIEKVNFRELLQPKLFKILLLGVGLAVFQQWCGINVIFNYAQEIFQSAGYDISTVLKNIAWTGSVNLAFNVVALGMVVRKGRRLHVVWRSGAGHYTRFSRYAITRMFRDFRCSCLCWQPLHVIRCRWLL